MNVSYKPLRHTLIEKGITISRLCADLDLSTAIRSKLNKDSDYVSLNTIEKICIYLDVPIESVVEISG